MSQLFLKDYKGTRWIGTKDGAPRFKDDIIVNEETKLLNGSL